MGVSKWIGIAILVLIIGVPSYFSFRILRSAFYYNKPEFFCSEHSDYRRDYLPQNKIRLGLAFASMLPVPFFIAAQLFVSDYSLTLKLLAVAAWIIGSVVGFCCKPQEIEPLKNDCCRFNAVKTTCTEIQRLNYIALLIFCYTNYTIMCNNS